MTSKIILEMLLWLFCACNLYSMEILGFVKLLILHKGKFEKWFSCKASRAYMPKSVIFNRNFTLFDT